MAEAVDLATEGEAYMAAYLDRHRHGAAPPGELATILAYLSGSMLAGACRATERALGGQHA